MVGIILFRNLDIIKYFCLGEILIKTGLQTLRHCSPNKKMSIVKSVVDFLSLGGISFHITVWGIMRARGAIERTAEDVIFICIDFLGKNATDHDFRRPLDAAESWTIYLQLPLHTRSVSPVSSWLSQNSFLRLLTISYGTGTIIGLGMIFLIREYLLWTGHEDRQGFGVWALEPHHWDQILTLLLLCDFGQDTELPCALVSFTVMCDCDGSNLMVLLQSKHMVSISSSV